MADTKASNAADRKDPLTVFCFSLEVKGDGIDIAEAQASKRVDSTSAPGGCRGRRSGPTSC
jgi:hypothetical protein